MQRSQRTLRRAADLIVGLLLLATTASCGGSAVAPATSIPSTTTTTTTSTTTTTTTTTPPTSSTTTTTPPTTTTFAIPEAPIPARSPRLLVAHDGGIDLWSRTGTMAVLTDGPIALAVPDLSGGVVFQRFAPDESNIGLMPIEWIPAPGEASRVLVPGSDEALYLSFVQVADVDGHPSLLYREWVEHENTCDLEDAECRWAYHVEWLHLLDLVTGEDRVLHAIGGFEGDAIDVRIGGAYFSIAVEGYGGESACIGYADLSRLLMGRPGTDLYEPCTMGPTPHCPDGGWCAGDVVAALSDDGSTLAYAVSAWSQDVGGPDRIWYSPEVTFLDTVTGAVLARHTIGTAGRVGPSFLDFDGQWAVLGRYDRELPGEWGRPNLAPLLVLVADPSGTTPANDELPLLWELPVTGRASIWREG